ncbi:MULTISPECIES: endolytic peptidoglycan transglycosylase RlpA [Enterobacterales]|uniref:Endolytic peptidoglycan transglycosylase RlpA n=1 Tax=Candidatus Sodalis endolongispinus TaxID=2812662 RepID=A0ABS5YC98_9GAMM|nr:MULTISPECIES: endolytic peptidoglycan transglycosylase RlpA [Enterobacterales]MBG6247532.1 endolytic peptidoglycan transglycosylase RlpA [Candidatus Symbiopectobacterium sp. PLON1]MBT9432589.1 endolytic peptidoglycan transglycosylase RlpA [Candidatus Sodalis endolongispinus]
MRKLKCVIGMMGLLLGACSTQQETQPSTSAQQVYTGPVVEISGVEPRYEPYNPGNMQYYTVNGKRYSIVQNPQNFSQTGLAAWYDSESGGNNTASGEPFDANALAAAHPTLPLPSYVRVTNLSNGRQLVVRVNDRGPYTPGRIIDLTRAAADRLNISNNTKVKVDVIQVAPDGTLTGPGTVGTVVAKQNYALPPRPDLRGGGGAGESVAALTSGNDAVSAGNNATVLSAKGGNSGNAGALLTSGTGATAAAQAGAANSAVTGTPQDATPLISPGQHRGFLGAPSALPAWVVETEPAVPAPSPAVAAPAAAVPAAASGRFMVQVGAIGDAQRAASWQQSLSQRFSVPGRVAANGNLYRMQLGPFQSRQQAQALVQRLQSEAQQSAFIAAQ